MRNTIILLFLLTTFLSSAQQEKGMTELKNRMQARSMKYVKKVNFKLARSFFFQEQWDSTIVYTAKELIQPNLDLELLNYCYLFRGHSFHKKKLYKEAETEFLKVKEPFYFYPIVQLYLAELALEQSNFDQSINYLKTANGLDLKELFGIERSDIDHNIGLTYLHKDQYDLAELYLKKSMKVYEENKNTIQLVGSYGDIANLYYEQYKDDQAIPYFIKAYELVKTTDDFNLKRRTAKNMSIVEENRKDYVKALKYRKEYEQWKDSLNDQNRIYETAQLEKKIAVEQKEKEVQVLEAENKAKEAQNRVYLFSGISLAVLLVIVFYSYKGTQKRNQIITAQKEDLDALNATKDKLFSIVSHDLRSSVNAIKTSNKKLLGNLDSQNKEEISQNLQQNSAIVNGAYGLLDNLLNWAMLQTKQSYFEMTQLSLSRIVDHVAFNYQPILEDQQIEYSNLVSKKTQVFADQESLKIILRNLLDNAIKFTKERGKISVYIQDSSDKYVHLVIEDSGLGMDAETRKELLKDTQLLSKKKHEDILGTGLGLHLVKSMIAKNQGKFDIESEEGKGTKMIISLLKSQES